MLILAIDTVSELQTVLLLKIGGKEKQKNLAIERDRDNDRSKKPEIDRRKKNVAVLNRVLKKKQWKMAEQKKDMTVENIDELMQGHTWKELSGIVVVAGPGPFTRLRIGITVANILVYTQNLPLYGLRYEHGNYTMDIELGSDFIEAVKQFDPDTWKKTKSLVPLYDRPPNITMPKAK